jgi:glutamate racemase
MNPPESIGFFDSGIGGFSVLRHAINSVDGIPLVYVADSKYAPYGGRDPEFVRERCCAIAGFLIDAGAGAIVVACNTATAIAIDALRDRFAVPIIGMEPGIKPAAAASRSGKVAVLATEGTLQSQRYARLISDHGREVSIHARACHHWVEAVEQGDLDTPELREQIRADIAPLQAIGVDTYVLGCTHYPYLAAQIRDLVGDAAQLIDPGPAVVGQLRRVTGISGDSAQRSSLHLYTSGDQHRMVAHAKRLLDMPFDIDLLPS